MRMTFENCRARQLLENTNDASVQAICQEILRRVVVDETWEGKG